jgi:hypothetical protein
MNDDRKKPLWPWIAALLIGLPVLYVFSSGPTRVVACRRYSLNAANAWDVAIIANRWWMTVYAPLCWLSENSEQPCAKVLDSYWSVFPIPSGDNSS